MIEEGKNTTLIAYSLTLKGLNYFQILNIADKRPNMAERGLSFS